jgi:dihydrofolate synthase / folylpolyglutamate synthase
MNYRQSLDYLYSRLPMFTRIGAAAYKKDLTNTIALCEFLDNPHKKIKTIHVAGTNGKGSVCHMLAAIFQTAGYKTGLYTSPHLKDFRERIKVNGEMISEEFVTRFTENIIPEINKIEPSFFEVTVAMAFDYFAKEKTDIAIIETGLGGRLDSTNVITPELSVITNIGWDHMNILGDSLEKIAFEKAGIIKPGVPVVIGELLPETKPVFEAVATKQKANLSIASEKRKMGDWRIEKNQLVAEVASEHKDDRHVYHLDLTGIYQQKNLLTVLETCAQAERFGWKVDNSIIIHALQHVKKLTGLHGRWEKIQNSPAVILDVAHNADGMKQLVQQIEITDHRELHIIFGMVKDKEIDTVLELLPKNAIYYFTKAQIPRALSEKILAEKSMEKGLKGESFPEVNIALQRALQKAHKDDLIVVCGSVFLAGEVNISKH